jgi:hypothetical protein
VFYIVEIIIDCGPKPLANKSCIKERNIKKNNSSNISLQFSFLDLQEVHKDFIKKDKIMEYQQE